MTTPSEKDPAVLPWRDAASLIEITRSSWTATAAKFLALSAQNFELIKQFLVETSLYRVSYQFFTQAALTTLSNKIFSDVVIRDFVLELSNSFYFRSPVIALNYEDAIQDISTCLVPYHSGDNPLVPEQISNSLPRDNEIYLVLVKTPWLLPLLLLNIYYSDVFKEDKKPGSSK